MISEPEQHQVTPLTREMAKRLASNLLSFSADQTWENWTEDHLTVDRPHKWLLSLVARRNEEPVGYAIVSSPQSNVHHLHRLAVAPQARGQGIGRMLMEKILSRASSSSAAVTLKVYRTNQEAESFYRNLGFVVVQDSDDQLIMSYTTL